MAIDKKKLIKEIEELPFIHGRYDHIHANPSFIGGCESMYELIKNVIETQPEISLETKTSDWIPCSERLPNETDMYYVTLSDGSVDELWFYIRDKRWAYGFEVLAWQPKTTPEPYKGKSK